MIDKKYAQRIHFKNRVQERLGLVINRDDISNLVTDIMREDNVINSYKVSQRKSIYDMIFKSKRCFIFFDHIRKTPITVYTKDMGITNILKRLEESDE
jgi:hypothetical protein